MTDDQKLSELGKLTPPRPSDAARRAFRHCQVTAAAAHGEAHTVESIDRTGVQAGLFDAAIAGMVVQRDSGKTDCPVKQQRPAKRLPEPIFGMDQQPQRRSRQAFRPLRPLLEGQIGPVRRKHRLPVQFDRNLRQHRLGPCIQRIGLIAVRLPPPGKMRPDR